MSATLNLPLWNCGNIPDCCEDDIDVIIKRLTEGELEEDELGNLQDNKTNVNTFLFNNNNNNIVVEKEELEDGLQCSENVSNESLVLCKNENENENENIEKDGVVSCGVSETSAEGGDCGERSECRQHELTVSPMEINTCDVTSSRDAIEPRSSENVCEKFSRLRTSSCSTSSSTCSAGSYSRRKHHKHKQNKREPPSPAPAPESELPKTPKVNPIFLWVRQDDTRIVEVLCEDYDHRNRIRLAKTPHGWRAIPKTERFSAAVLPKVTSPSETATGDIKHSRKSKKRKKKTRKCERNKKSSKHKHRDIKLRECSVTLSREDLNTSQYSKQDEDVSVEVEREEIENEVEEETKAEQEEEREEEKCSSVENKESHDEDESRENKRNTGHERSRDSSLESIKSEMLVNTRKLPKSVSCEFESSKRQETEIKRSSSVDLSLSRGEEMDSQPIAKPKPAKISVKTFLNQEIVQVKSEPETEVTKREENKKDRGLIEASEVNAEDVDEIINNTTNSDPNILDMTEQGSDFNDTDCDELGQLLKDIPDLEFDVEEREDASLPTDLTLPKTKQEESKTFPTFPLSISSIVTVTSSTKPPEPLTAPLPEVTITPIPNPKPAHQQKPQNKFLESLLSSPRLIKPERDEITITRTSSRSSTSPDKRCGGMKSEHEPKMKKFKIEDITLKSLLSKHQEQNNKNNDLENCVKKIRSKHECSENIDYKQSRLQELLTDNTCSSTDPITQLKQVLSNPELSVPDPLLVPRARLPALVASPASEIPRLLTLRTDKKVEETPACPQFTDPDMLVVSLAHLQSLLSYNPDSKQCADADDLAAYQKSLEAFLEWQRYQTQLMEAQLKKSPHGPGLTPVDIDVATATALNQMLWLPYLNQLESCGNNRELVSAMNAMFQANNMPVPPHINTNHFQHSSPFLTPTSPLEIEAQMKTLAMWQEAVMTQQQTKQQPPSIKIPNVPHPTQNRKQQHSRTSPMSMQQGKNSQQRPQQQNNNNYPFQRFESAQSQLLKNQYSYEYQMQLQHQNMLRQQAQYEYQRKQKQKLDLHFQKQIEQQECEIRRRQKEMQYIQEQQMLQLQQYQHQQQYDSCYQDETSKMFKREKTCEIKPTGGISVKPLSNLLEQPHKRKKSSSSWQQFEEDIKKNAEITNQMALRWQQFEEEMRKSQIQISKNQKQKSGIKSEVNSDVIWSNNDGHDVKNVQLTTETPKLKVKNLVDPNMAPPKLLKHLDPSQMHVEEITPHIKEDPHSSLWHPLFGSNQGNNKNQGYTGSRWTWTTVTVNGE